MIIKKEDPRPMLPVIILLYGVPGSGKTSVATTSANPVIIDTDRGSQRACQIIDTVFCSSWQDVVNEMNANSFASYKTVILDTAKGALDDFIQFYVEQQDVRLKTNSLKRFGKMADTFKDFVSRLRSYGCDIIFICHDKAEQEGDIVKHSPDCTGQSKQLLMRIADQIGFVDYSNTNSRTIKFGPMYNYVSKDVAQLGDVPVPDFGTPEFSTFMGDVIQNVKDSIANKSEAQREANLKLKTLRTKLEEADSEKAFASLMKDAGTLPEILKGPFFHEMCNAAQLKGMEYDKESKSFKKTA